MSNLDPGRQNGDDGKPISRQSMLSNPQINCKLGLHKKARLLCLRKVQSHNMRGIRMVMPCVTSNLPKASKSKRQGGLGRHIPEQCHQAMTALALGSSH